MIFCLDVSEFGDVVAAVLSWPAHQSRNVKCLNGLAVLGSRKRSPVRSCRCGHHHWTKGELFVFFYVNTTGGCGTISGLVPLEGVNESMRVFMLLNKTSH